MTFVIKNCKKFKKYTSLTEREFYAKMKSSTDNIDYDDFPNKTENAFLLAIYILSWSEKWL